MAWGCAAAAHGAQPGLGLRSHRLSITVYSAELKKGGMRHFHAKNQKIWGTTEIHGKEIKRGPPRPERRPAFGAVLQFLFCFADCFWRVTAVGVYPTEDVEPRRGQSGACHGDHWTGGC